VQKNGRKVGDPSSASDVSAAPHIAKSSSSGEKNKPKNNQVKGPEDAFGGVSFLTRAFSRMTGTVGGTRCGNEGSLRINGSTREASRLNPLRRSKTTITHSKKPPF